MSLQHLRNRQELTIWKRGPVERRIRRRGNTFQIYDIHWALHKANHIALTVGPYQALHIARVGVSIFEKMPGVPYVKKFQRPKSRLALPKHFVRESRNIENRLFHKKRVSSARRTQLLVIAGGRK